MYKQYFVSKIIMFSFQHKNMMRTRTFDRHGNILVGHTIFPEAGCQGNKKNKISCKNRNGFEY